MTASLQELYPEHLHFLNGVYEFNDTLPAFDLLAGNSHIRTMILNAHNSCSIISSWQNDEAEFAEFKKGFHLYD